MSLPLQSYTWDRIRYALIGYVGVTSNLLVSDPGDGTAQVAWTANDQGPMPKPNVTLSSFSSQNIGFPDAYYHDKPTSQLLTITQVVVGEPVVMNLIWSEVRLDVVGGDALTDTRDKYLLALQAGVAETREPLIFAASGAVDILITARPFAFPDVEAVQGCTLAVVTEDRARVVSVAKRYRVRMQLHGFAIAGDNAIDEYASMLKTNLEVEEGLDLLHPYGVGVDGIPATTTNVTVKSGALLETRVFFDFNAVTRQTTYKFASVNPALDQTIDQVDPPSIEGAFV